jgi:hypothetical protein
MFVPGIFEIHFKRWTGKETGRLFLFCFSVCAFLIPVFGPPLQAVGEIRITNVAARQKTPGKFILTANVANSTGEPREVVFRAQLTFYDKTSPPGDLPATVVQKDFTIILKAGQERSLEVPIILEGKLPPGSLRMEPSLRIRRQREWMYR